MFRCLAATLLALLAATGCAGTSDHALRNLDDLARATSTTTTIKKPGSNATCDDALKSYRPTDPLPQPTQMAPGSFMAAIQEHGRLRVGVDENTPGFAFRDPKDGTIKGFEVELANEIAARIFGPERSGESVEFVPVLTDEKIPFVEQGRVDLTIDAVSMTCDRWEMALFSSEYYTAEQAFLVPKNSPIVEASDLPGRRICVTKGSSSVGIMKKSAPGAMLHEVPERTACLVALQEHQVDAYFGHDSFLYGMLAQDPTLTIRRDVLPPEATVSHYGIAVAATHPEFVRFINAVLEQLSETTWDRLHRPLTESAHIPADRIAAKPPEPQYRD